MAVAALVHPDRLDKPSLMLTGQPEKEVREHSHLILAIDQMKYILTTLGLIMKTVSYPPHCDQRAMTQLSFKILNLNSFSLFV